MLCSAAFRAADCPSQGIQIQQSVGERPSEIFLFTSFRHCTPLSEQSPRQFPSQQQHKLRFLERKPQQRWSQQVKNHAVTARPGLCRSVQTPVLMPISRFFHLPRLWNFSAGLDGSKQTLPDGQANTGHTFRAADSLQDLEPMQAFAGGGGREG